MLCNDILTITYHFGIQSGFESWKDGNIYTMELNKGDKSEYDLFLIDRLDLRESYGVTLN